MSIILKILFFSLIFIFKSNLVYSNTQTEYKQYDKLPCNFNGAKVGDSAYPRVERDKSYSYKINRCTKSVTKPKNLRSFGRNGKEVTDINVPRNTPIVAVRDMEFFFASDISSKNFCQEHKDHDIGETNIKLPDPMDPSQKRKCKTPYDNVDITFKDILTGDIIYYSGLKSTPLVPGFGKDKCKIPYMRDRNFDEQNNITKYLKKRFDHVCGGPIKKIVKKGEVIGFSGKRGKYSSFGFNIKKKDQEYIIAPEDNLAWENFPNDKNRFLIPVVTDSQIETMKIAFEKSKDADDKQDQSKNIKVSKNINENILKSALQIDKSKEIFFLNMNPPAFSSYVLLINDLRGDGPVYYFFNIDQYHRVSKDFKILSNGKYNVKNVYKKNTTFELTEEDQKFSWRISLKDKIVDIKSDYYAYKGFKRYTIASPDKLKRDKVKDIVKNQFAGFDDSDDNLNRLYKLIMEDKYFLKKNKYLKYSKKGRYNGKTIKTMGLAVFINYEKELSKLTDDIYLKEISPFAWGWEYSYEDKQEFTGWKAIQKCYAHVKKRKLHYSDGECIVVDFRRILDDWSYPVAAENYLYKVRENKLLIAKKLEDSTKTKEQLEKEKKKQQELLAKQKKDAEEKKKQLLIAQKKAEEERKKQEEILLVKKKQEEEKKNALILAQIKANEKKVIKDKARYLEKKMLVAFLDTNEIALDDLRGDGKVYYQFEKNKYLRIQRNGKFISEGEYKISKSGEITLKENKDKFFWKLSVRDGVIDIKSKFYPYKGYKRFALDFVYKSIAKEQREDLNKLAKIEEEERKELEKKQLKSEEDKKVKELLLAQKKAEEELKKQEKLLAEKKAEEERKKKELIAQQKAEEERKKQEEIAKKKAIEDEKKQKILAEEKKKKEELLAKLKAEEEEALKKLEVAQKEAEEEFEKKKKKLDVDKESPEILVAEVVTVSSQVYKLTGKVKDKSEFFLEIDGQPVKINNDGDFIFEGFIIDTDEGEELTLVAIDRWNNSSEKNVKINVEMKEAQVVKTYEKLLPSKIKAKQDENKVALVIGVEKYENLNNLDAIYANRDAKAFRAYANRAFGVPLENIKVLIDKEASRSDIIKATKLWLPQLAKGGGKDIYIFFAGHGLASDDGENLFLLPQDGDSLLLEDTALSRSDMFKQISKLNPNSVTIFFDTCYSGQTRSEETLIAGLRPVRLVVDEQEVPNNFTIFSASNLTQTSGSIEQAKHGIFSYYLMKGLEGNADKNSDNQITNGELIAYLKQNVSEEAFINNRQQEPMLSGDPDKVLINFR
ncbi:MAG: hypothetical protein CL836_01835 [Crocinitomicaceae bacterium]|nr:hypothetical protein [Crocinitomicaceae bacterium]